jgi:hypothetical protein
VREVVKFRPRSLSLSLSLARSLGGLEASWQRNATASLGRSVSQSLSETLDKSFAGSRYCPILRDRFKDLR